MSSLSPEGAEPDTTTEMKEVFGHLYVYGLKSGEVEETLKATEKRITCGRDACHNIRLHDLRVSRTHFEINIKDNNGEREVVFKNLTSKGSTMINDQILVHNEEVILKNCQQIRVGNRDLEWRTEREPNKITVDPPINGSSISHKSIGILSSEDEAQTDSNEGQNLDESNFNEDLTASNPDEVGADLFNSTVDQSTDLDQDGVLSEHEEIITPKRGRGRPSKTSMNPSTSTDRRKSLKVLGTEDLPVDDPEDKNENVVLTTDRGRQQTRRYDNEAVAETENVEAIVKKTEEKVNKIDTATVTDDQPPINGSSISLKSIGILSSEDEAQTDSTKGQNLDGSNLNEDLTASNPDEVGADLFNNTVDQSTDLDQDGVLSEHEEIITPKRGRGRPSKTSMNPSTSTDRRKSLKVLGTEDLPVDDPEDKNENVVLTTDRGRQQTRRYDNEAVAETENVEAIVKKTEEKVNKIDTATVTDDQPPINGSSISLKSIGILSSEDEAQTDSTKGQNLDGSNLNEDLTASNPDEVGADLFNNTVDQSTDLDQDGVLSEHEEIITPKRGRGRPSKTSMNPSTSTDRRKSLKVLGTEDLPVDDPEDKNENVVLTTDRGRQQTRRYANEAAAEIENVDAIVKKTKEKVNKIDTVTVTDDQPPINGSSRSHKSIGILSSEDEAQTDSNEGQNLDGSNLNEDLTASNPDEVGADLFNSTVDQCIDLDQDGILSEHEEIITPKRGRPSKTSMNPSTSTDRRKSLKVLGTEDLPVDDPEDKKENVVLTNDRGRQQTRRYANEAVAETENVEAIVKKTKEKVNKILVSPKQSCSLRKRNVDTVTVTDDQPPINGSSISHKSIGILSSEDEAQTDSNEGQNLDESNFNEDLTASNPDEVGADLFNSTVDQSTDLDQDGVLSEHEEIITPKRGRPSKTSMNPSTSTERRKSLKVLETEDLPVDDPEDKKENVVLTTDRGRQQTKRYANEAAAETENVEAIVKKNKSKIEKSVASPKQGRPQRKQKALPEEDLSTDNPDNEEDNGPTTSTKRGRLQRKRNIEIVEEGNDDIEDKKHKKVTAVVVSKRGGQRQKKVNVNVTPELVEEINKRGLRVSLSRIDEPPRSSSKKEKVVVTKRGRQGQQSRKYANAEEDSTVANKSAEATVKKTKEKVNKILVSPKQSRSLRKRNFDTVTVTDDQIVDNETLEVKGKKPAKVTATATKRGRTAKKNAETLDEDVATAGENTVTKRKRYANEAAAETENVEAIVKKNKSKIEKSVASPKQGRPQRKQKALPEEDLSTDNPDNEEDNGPTTSTKRGRLQRKRNIEIVEEGNDDIEDKKHKKVTAVVVSKRGGQRQKKVNVNVTPELVEEINKRGLRVSLSRIDEPPRSSSKKEKVVVTKRGRQGQQSRRYANAEEDSTVANKSAEATVKKTKEKVNKILVSPKQSRSLRKRNFDTVTVTDDQIVDNETLEVKGKKPAKVTATATKRGRTAKKNAETLDEDVATDGENTVTKRKKKNEEKPAIALAKQGRSQKKTILGNEGDAARVAMNTRSSRRTKAKL